MSLIFPEQINGCWEYLSYVVEASGSICLCPEVPANLYSEWRIVQIFANLRTGAAAGNRLHTLDIWFPSDRHPSSALPNSWSRKLLYEYSGVSFGANTTRLFTWGTFHSSDNFSRAIIPPLHFRTPSNSSDPIFRIGIRDAMQWDGDNPNPRAADAITGFFNLYAKKR
jgi:hypothetical protein